MGFVRIEHIASRYKIAKVTAYARLRKLVSQDFIEHEILFHNEAGHYRVTREGTLISGDPLPAMKKIILSRYHHDEMVTRLSLKLLQQYGGTFTTERQLRRNLGIMKARVQTHLSDGVLRFDDKTIAFEVELSTKGNDRLKKIMEHYLFGFECDEVWYFCGNQEVKNKIEKAALDSPMIKVYLIDDYLKNDPINI